MRLRREYGRTDLLGGGGLGCVHEELESVAHVALSHGHNATGPQQSRDLAHLRRRYGRIYFAAALIGTRVEFNGSG